ncbi:unnamed protein product [Owenia fusiformis]|uniref:Tyrosyl-DNA phosphodiesterase 1 n=1 Tax=Owenia fusiformis TaxID=6347 RepID=A0A8S4PDB6_OWEFU|nr:unnamed protein product [Owenia fusiformis]
MGSQINGGMDSHRVCIHNLLDFVQCNSCLKARNERNEFENGAFNVGVIPDGQMAELIQDDEELARKLQIEFDAELLEASKRQEEDDYALAVSIAQGAHDISDSDSDNILFEHEHVNNIEECIDTFQQNQLKSAKRTHINNNAHIENNNYNVQTEILASDSDSDCTVDLESNKSEGNLLDNKHRQLPVGNKDPDLYYNKMESKFTSRSCKAPLKRSHSGHDISDSDSSNDETESKGALIEQTISDSDSKNSDIIIDEPKTRDVSKIKGKSKCSTVSGSSTPGTSLSKENRQNKHSTDSLKRDYSKSPPSKKQRLDKASLQTAKHSSSSSSRSDPLNIIEACQPLNFLLTKVTGIQEKYNRSGAVGIKDLLSPSLGSLQESVQFNYMIDIPWLVQQYPPQFRSKPLVIVHGHQRQAKMDMDVAADHYKHIKLVNAKLEIMYGTHHTKMMLLFYDIGMRVVIHTANLIEKDWHQKTQGVWISPMFPKCKTASDAKDSSTNFKQDLIQYMEAYRTPHFKSWLEKIKLHDMSSAKVHIIASVPGRHIGPAKQTWGHFKLRKILRQLGPGNSCKSWPVIGQFSSIGSMGPTKESWVYGEFTESLATTKDGGASLTMKPTLKLIYPSKDNVRTSLEGYPAGGSLPYSIKTAVKQQYMHQFWNHWKSEHRGRSAACPHIKTYTRSHPDGTSIAWFAVTSANLSKAAWGALEKKGQQLMIRSYEIGVLFLPQNYGLEKFKTLEHASEDPLAFPVPYDLPPTHYEKSDRPWVWDIPYMDKPDTHGNKWCPQ